MKEERKAAVSITNAGGTAGKNSKRYRITIPSSWAKEMGVSEESREVVISFDGIEMTIRKEEL